MDGAPQRAQQVLPEATPPAMIESPIAAVGEVLVDGKNVIVVIEKCSGTVQYVAKVLRDEAGIPINRNIQEVKINQIQIDGTMAKLITEPAAQPAAQPAAEGGGGALNTIRINNRDYKIRTEGRKKYIMYKKQKVSVSEARKLAKRVSPRTTKKAKK